MEDNAQVLEELCPHIVLGLARENRSSFGKFEQDLSGRRSPRTPTSIDNDGRYRETIDCEVKSKRSAAALTRQIDVCRAAGVRRGWSDPILWERTHERAWLEKSRFFQFWV